MEGERKRLKKNKMRKPINKLKSGDRLKINAMSLSDFVISIAHEILLSSQLQIRTNRGNLLHRKDARLILANKIKVNRLFFGVLITEMERKGIVELNNQGIYIKDLGTGDIPGAVSKNNSA